MRVLLDECLPAGLRRELAGLDVSTAHHAGLSGLQNGILLSRIEGRFDVFLTIDRNLAAQNVLARRSFGVVVVIAQSNRLAALTALVPQIKIAVESIKPGEIIVLGR